MMYRKGPPVNSIKVYINTGMGPPVNSADKYIINGWAHPLMV
jgi:hypothetical protein